MGPLALAYLVRFMALEPMRPSHQPTYVMARVPSRPADATVKFDVPRYAAVRYLPLELTSRAVRFC